MGDKSPKQIHKLAEQKEAKHEHREHDKEVRTEELHHHGSGVVHTEDELKAQAEKARPPGKEIPPKV